MNLKIKIACSIVVGILLLAADFAHAQRKEDPKLTKARSTWLKQPCVRPV